MDVLGIIGGILFAFAFLFFMSARKEIERDYHFRHESSPRMLKMKRVSGQVMAVGGIMLLLSIAFGSAGNEETKGDTPVVKSEEVSVPDEKVKVDTNLVIGEVADLPKVPDSYTDRYNEVNEVITRTDAFLDLIKKNLSECDGPCDERPLTEIQDRFDAMDELFTIVRNQLQKASEIVNEMALEDPTELHTQKLFELEENLQATAYSLETMQIADSWESWDEPIEYVENTRTNRLYATPLADTILPINANNQNDVSQTSDEIFQEAEYFKAVGLTIEFGQEMMTELSYMSYMCGKVCPDVPGDTWALQLESMNEEVFSLQRNMYQFALELRQIPKGSSENINFEGIEGLASQMELFADYITPIMTKLDWTSWEEAHAAVDEAIAIINEMRVEDVYTLPTSE